MNKGKVLHVCISAKKGIAKHEISAAKLVVEHGMEGDAHAGDWHRQVSLLAHTYVEFMRAKGLKLKPGAFGENLVIDGLNVDELGVGSQLRVGSVLLEFNPDRKGVPHALRHLLLHWRLHNAARRPFRTCAGGRIRGGRDAGRGGAPH